METINNKNIYDTVRINIKKYRKLKEMTQQELSDADYLIHGYIRDSKYYLFLLLLILHL